MPSTKIITIINVALGLTALILILSLLGVSMPSVGSALYALDSEEAVCVTSYKDNYKEMAVNLCCIELQTQLNKGEPYNQELAGFKVSKHYYTSKNTINYFVNNKAYRYCKNNGFLV
ncbi:MAG: hypothetical protein KJ597_06665 [Nanoarchaeota archaeon]|nr:hypothetical protein [Nanoarchaeota archaeon]